jgi:hypothetical protein
MIYNISVLEAMGIFFGTERFLKSPFFYFEYFFNVFFARAMLHGGQPQRFIR